MSLTVPTKTPEVARGVTRLPILFVNTYFIEGSNGWVLIDTGLPNSSGYIRRAAEVRFGAGSRPQAILLTHGHFDHAGSALELAKQWNVPIYAHRLELPYLTGRSDYPPKDPTMGGAIALMARAFPDSGYDFGDRVRELPAEGGVPGLPEWRWLHTPGHTPGHVSFWRESDRTLLAGDAFATMDLDSWTAQVTHARELSRPPAPFTPDWSAARRSVDYLAGLGPQTLATGHGRAVSDSAAARLKHFAQTFSPPEQGRYVGHPVRADESGIVAVPPPASDPLPKQLATVALVGLAGAAFYYLERRNRQRNRAERR